MKLTYDLTAREREFCDRLTCAGNHVAKYNTWQVAEAVLAEKVPGDFAEAGVYLGAHPAVILRVLQKYGVRDRKVHLFDSFEGIPRATVNDNVADQLTYGLRDGALETSGISAAGVADVTRNLKKWGVYDPDLVVFWPGWFEETLATVARSVGDLALLRVDVDLYQSTVEVFRHLYPRVVAGGFVIDDDYGSPECRKAMDSLVGVASVTRVSEHGETVWWRKT